MADLRQIPSVDELARRLESEIAAPRAVLVEEARTVVDAVRRDLIAGIAGPAAEERLRDAMAALLTPSLERVINATGVILHTNLGRAPLPPFELPAGYSNLEYDIGEGRRGRRDVHIKGLIQRLTGRPGILVNNNAAAVYLVLNELAGGGEVIVSRGELIEIGDGFRIPDIMARSGAVLREVGTTNRTRLDDYREAIGERTRMLMRVHPSNFSMSGFTGRPGLGDLSALAREYGLILYEDLGSGCLVDLARFGVHEPTVTSSLHAGASIVSFSGDKLLGGPQAGIIAGDAPLVGRVRRNPMFRALRVDKLIYAAMETTLRRVLLEQWDGIPALRMISMGAAEIRLRAQRLAADIDGAEVVEGRSVIGGGSTPAQSIATWLIRLSPGDAVRQEQRLRAGRPPVIARIEDGRVLIDLRTVFEEEEHLLKSALMEAIHGNSRDAKT